MSDSSHQHESPTPADAVTPNLDAAPTPPVVGERLYGILNTNRHELVFTNRQSGLEQSSVGPNPAIVRDDDTLELQLGRQQHAFGVDHLGPVTLDLLPYDTSGSNGTIDDVQHMPRMLLGVVINEVLDGSPTVRSRHGAQDKAQAVYAALLIRDAHDRESLEFVRQRRAEIYDALFSSVDAPLEGTGVGTPDEFFDNIEADCRELGLLSVRPRRETTYVESAHSDD